MNTRETLMVGVATLVIVWQSGCAASMQGNVSTDQEPRADRPLSAHTGTDEQWMSEWETIALGPMMTWHWLDSQPTTGERSSSDCSAYLRHANLVPIDLDSTYEERLVWYEANAIPIYNDRPPVSDVISEQTWDTIDWLRVNPDGYPLAPDQEPARTPDTDPN